MGSLAKEAYSRSEAEEGARAARTRSTR